MLVVRLLVGLLKGLILGGLIGFGLAAAGMAVPSALIIYPLAAVMGVLVALVAGKPIWAKGARIEVGMKAAAGALLAPGFLWLVRRYLTFDMPFDVSALPGLSAASGYPQIGEFAVTSLAAVAALLAGFFDADNQPEPEQPAGARVATGASKKRVAASSDDAASAAAELEASELEATERRTRK